MTTGDVTIGDDMKTNDRLAARSLVLGTPAQGRA
jgi:hypothetical protein